MIFQRTATSVLTGCLTPGDKRTIAQSYLKSELECIILRPLDLVAKVYAENTAGPIAKETIHLEEPAFQVDLSDKPTFVSVALVSKVSSEMVDEKRFVDRSPWQQPDVFFETAEHEIEQMLLTGEGETAEFREKLDNPIRLAKTATAFSNTSGGTIVVGVNNDHRVVGCEIKGLADTVTNVLRAHCDPPPTVTTEVVVYQDKKLFLIRVPKSTGAVCVVRDHGPYVRANASNRTPTSHELENLSSKDISLDGIPAVRGRERLVP